MSDHLPLRYDVLLPPTPEERTGWGRLRHIIRDYPTAPIEVLIGAGNVVRGIYVAWPGHHPSYPLFPGSMRLSLAILMTVLGAVQVWACLWEKGAWRSLAAILLTAVLTYIGLIYSASLDAGDLGQTIVVFYGLLATGELWVAARTPSILRSLLAWIHSFSHQREPAHGTGHRGP